MSVAQRLRQLIVFLVMTAAFMLVSRIMFDLLAGRPMFWTSQEGIETLLWHSMVGGPFILFALLVAGAAISAVGGPMQDITVATLRQMLVPRRDMGAAVRAFMLVNQTGSLLAMLAAPSAFEAIGIAPAVVVCGVAIIAVGLVGMRRFGGGGATRTVQAGPL